MDVKIDMLFEEIASLKAKNNNPYKTVIEIDPLFNGPDLPISNIGNLLMINNNCLTAVYKDQLVCMNYLTGAKMVIFKMSNF